MDHQAEFTSFVQANSRSLQQAAWLLTGNWDEAQDLVQTALARVWTRWDKIRDPDRAPAYTRRALMTTFLNGRERRWLAELALGWMPERREPASDDEISTRHSVTAALRQLPPGQRAVIVLRFFQDLTEAATADALGCSVGTVKSQTARALARLRSHPDIVSVFHERT